MLISKGREGGAGKSLGATSQATSGKKKRSSEEPPSPEAAGYRATGGLTDRQGGRTSGRPASSGALLAVEATPDGKEGPAPRETTAREVWSRSSGAVGSGDPTGRRAGKGKERRRLIPG